MENLLGIFQQHFIFSLTIEYVWTSRQCSWSAPGTRTSHNPEGGTSDHQPWTVSEVMDAAWYRGSHRVSTKYPLNLSDLLQKQL